MITGNTESARLLLVKLIQGRSNPAHKNQRVMKAIKFIQDHKTEIIQGAILLFVFWWIFG